MEARQKKKENQQITSAYHYEQVPSSLGFLTKKQFEVLCLREKGYLQREVANELCMSRSSVSMIEARARAQIRKARRTLQVFEKARANTQHRVVIEKGTRLQKMPLIVLEEADRLGIHMRSNMVEILRIVKRERSYCLSEDDGRTTARLIFSFNDRGKLKLL